MNDQLQAALASILERAESGIDSGVAFLSAQLPDVIQQLLVWKMLQHLIPMVFLILVFLALAGGTLKILSLMANDPRKAAEEESGRQRRIWYHADAGSEAEADAKKAMEQARMLARSLPDKEPYYTMGAIMCGIASFAFLVVFLTHANLTWLQIWIAPKIYLIEYAASLAK